MSTVSISSDAVGDALQICHTAAKELRANASELNIRLSTLELKHQELTERMKKATDDLASVSEQLSAAPKLADTPRRLAELQITVADFGSQVGITFLVILKCYSTFRLEGLLGLESASPGNTTRLRLKKIYKLN